MKLRKTSKDFDEYTVKKYDYEEVLFDDSTSFFFICFIIGGIGKKLLVFLWNTLFDTIDSEAS